MVAPSVPKSRGPNQQPDRDEGDSVLRRCEQVRGNSVARGRGIENERNGQDRYSHPQVRVPERVIGMLNT